MINHYTSTARCFSICSRTWALPCLKGMLLHMIPRWQNRSERQSTSRIKIPTMIIASTRLSTTCLYMFGIYCQAIELTSPSCQKGGQINQPICMISVRLLHLRGRNMHLPTCMELVIWEKRASMISSWQSTSHPRLIMK